jgi:hypothetical protein
MCYAAALDQVKRPPLDRSVPWSQLTLHGKEKVYGSIP